MAKHMQKLISAYRRDEPVSKDGQPISKEDFCTTVKGFFDEIVRMNPPKVGEDLDLSIKHIAQYLEMVGYDVVKRKDDP